MLHAAASILPVILESLSGTLRSGVSAEAVQPQQGQQHGSLVLIENRGQWPIEADLVGRLGPLMVRLNEDAIELQLRSSPTSGTLVRLALEGASGSATLGGAIGRPGHYSYFLGNDPTQWQRAVPAWEEANYHQAWQGVDIVVHAEGAHLKYDLMVAPGADLGRAVFAVKGAEGMRLEADGSLVIETAAGPIVQPVPASHEVLASGEMRVIAVRYRLLEGMRFGFEVDARDATLPLVIDPGLIWSTYVGSASIEGVGDRVQAIALGPNGEAIVAGIADWIDFPVTPGAYTSPPGTGERAFVSVFGASGSSLVYSCVVGGDSSIAFGYTRALAVGVDSTGEVVAAGWTSHYPTFPTTVGAFDPIMSSGLSAFAFKLKRDGSDLVYSTFLEGSQAQEACALAVTPGGAAIVGGWTNSQDYPTTSGAFDTVQGPFGSGFISRLDPSGSFLEFSTLLKAGPRAVTVDAGESVFVTGISGGSLPATIGAFDKTFNGGTNDGFVARLSADGKSLLWGTYLGGLAEDRPNAIAVDSAGGVIIGGTTLSLDFPVTPGAIQPAHSPYFANNYDMFVTKLNASGSALDFSTYLGGSGHTEEVFGLAADAGGVVTIAGTSGLAGIPATPGAHDSVAQNDECFVGRLSPDGKRIIYWSFVGGEGVEQFQAMAMDAQGIVTAGGWTTGPYPVTPGAFATTPFGGQLDGMVTRMDLLPKGAMPFGTSTPSCYGPLVIGVTEMPIAGSSTFGLYASGAPPGGSGLLGLAPSALSPGLPIVGLTLLIDPGPGLIVLPATAQATPYAEITVPIPAGATGHRAHAQFVFLNTAACGGLGIFSATNAFTLTVQ